MSAQFTPAPWLVNPVKAWVEIPGADAPICAMLWPTDLRSEAETFANARLIAAAPELYEALRNLADRWFLNGGSMTEPAYLAAKDALAKARNQSTPGDEG